MSTYYRAKRDAFDHFTGYPVIEGELLTPRERHTQARYLPDALFEIVEISRKKTHKFFGVRLENERTETNASDQHLSSHSNSIIRVHP